MKKAAVSLLLLAAFGAAGCGSSSTSNSSSTSSSAAPGAGSTTTASSSAAAAASTCPHNPVRFAVEPYDTGPALEKAYGSLATDIGQALGCKVQLIISNSYVAEIEAMRGGNLEMGEFGPLGYILAHKIAGAQPVAAFGDKSRQARRLHRGHLGQEELPDHQPQAARGQEGRAVEHDVDLGRPVPDLGAHQRRLQVHRQRLPGPEGRLHRRPSGVAAGAHPRHG